MFRIAILIGRFLSPIIFPLLVIAGIVMAAAGHKQARAAWNFNIQRLRWALRLRKQLRTAEEFAGYKLIINPDFIREAGLTDTESYFAVAPIGFGEGALVTNRIPNPKDLIEKALLTEAIWCIEHNCKEDSSAYMKPAAAALILRPTGTDADRSIMEQFGAAVLYAMLRYKIMARPAEAY